MFNRGLILKIALVLVLAIGIASMFSLSGKLHAQARPYLPPKPRISYLFQPVFPGSGPWFGTGISGVSGDFLGRNPLNGVSGFSFIGKDIVPTGVTGVGGATGNNNGPIVANSMAQYSARSYAPVGMGGYGYQFGYPGPSNFNQPNAGMFMGPQQPNQSRPMNNGQAFQGGFAGGFGMAYQGGFGGGFNTTFQGGYGGFDPMFQGGLGGVNFGFN